jgi:CRISPR-associated protein Cas1
MQDHRTAASGTLKPSREGILFVSGFATSLRVDRGHVAIRTGAGRHIAEGRFARVSRPRLRRLVIFGKGGFATFEALAWLHAVGCTFVHLSRDGSVIASSGEIAGGQPALRRAQARALRTDVGLELTRLVLRRKLDGQRENVERWFDDSAAAATRVIAEARARLETCETTREAMTWEARAASAYWSCWSDKPIRFARCDTSKIPEHWSVVGDRHSMLTTSPRLATSAAQAIVNYLGGLSEWACVIALRSAGLDPDIGWLHTDAAYRASAALDLQEVLRPQADAFALDLFRSRTFSRKEFIEIPTGQVRLHPTLAKLLAEAALPTFERVAHSAAQDVAQVLAGSVPGRVRVRTRQGPKNAGSVVQRTPRASRARRLESPCRMCGVMLEDSERAICDECLPTYAAERTEKLATAGKEVLARMRASTDDPARSPAAVAKRSATIAQREAERRSWDRQHGSVVDAARYERDVLPIIVSLTTAELARRTGLTKSFCNRVRAGERRLHARHWASVVGASPRQ